MADWRRFANLFREAAHDAEVTPATTFEVDDSPRRHARYQRRLVRSTIGSGIVGVLLGVAISLVQFAQGEPRWLQGLIRVPPVCGVLGVFFALAVGCLVVPSDFLKSPVGEAWMRIIGVKTVAGARIVCFIFVLVVTVPIVGLVAMILLTQP